MSLEFNKTKMSICVYCREDKQEFNEDHVVSPCFGAKNKVLEDLVCKDCNKAFDREFERKFLKGSNVESFLRGIRGLKGRRSAPVYGDDSHGSPVYCTVLPDFPQIRCLFSKSGPQTPFQLILEDTNGNLDYILQGKDITSGDILNVLNTLFNQSNIAPVAKKAYLWVHERRIPLATYRNMKKYFYIWLGQKRLDGKFRSTNVRHIPVPAKWETEERRRMYSKMVLNFLFWNIEKRDLCLCSSLDSIREFVRFGQHSEYKFVRQWEGPNPFRKFVNDETFDLMMGLFKIPERLIGLVFIRGVGPFLVDLGTGEGIPELPRAVALFKNGDNKVFIYSKPLITSMTEWLVLRTEFKTIFPELSDNE